jgi:hypothetical protein
MANLRRYVKTWGDCPPHLQRTLLEDELGPEPQHSETLAAMAPLFAREWVRDSLARLPEDMQTDQSVVALLHRHLGLLLDSAKQCGSFAQYQAIDRLTADDRAQAIRNELLMPMSISEAPFPEKWKHWKPRLDSTGDPMHQRQLEQRLADKWAERLLKHFYPVAAQSPRLRDMMEEVKPPNLAAPAAPGAAQSPAAMGAKLDRRAPPTGVAGRSPPYQPWRLRILAQSSRSPTVRWNRPGRSASAQ